MNELATIDAVSILEFEVFEGIPVWLIGLGMSISLIFILFILFISWIVHAERVVERREHHAPSSHDVMVELQREVLRSMAATSRQNWLMIWLTVLFITVSVLGGAVVMNIVQNVGDFGATWLAQFIEFINSFLSQ